MTNIMNVLIHNEKTKLNLMYLCVIYSCVSSGGNSSERTNLQHFFHDDILLRGDVVEVVVVGLVPGLTLDTDIGPQQGRSQHDTSGPPGVLICHVYGLLEGLTALVHVLGQQHLVVRVDTGLNGTIEDEFHELILQIGEVGVETLRHLWQVGREVGTKVLHQASVPDHRK